MSGSAPDIRDPDASSHPEIAYGRSADGLLVALVGDTAFAMVPAREGRHVLASGSRLRLPMHEWTRDRFFGQSGELADEAAFRAGVREHAEHQREKRALHRKNLQSCASTPWGSSQGATLYAEGVICHSTAGHSGFHLSASRNAQVHPMLRSEGGWYESHD
ncbi:MAG: hypothetical protein J0H44_21430 [Alphaproteobacteria bacterium]|mgnify:CR=1 FL=1|nr:hypothetical protein [Alphaproteobacteria bacterium]